MTWEEYVGQGLPTPTAADRARIEQAGGGAVPDDYWDLVRAHQGQVAEEQEKPAPGHGPEGLGVLLLAISPEAAGRDASYCIATCLRNMADYYPAGLLPFADDTGGNYWAFDFRYGGAPRIVFIDHEIAGEAGITPVAADFTVFMRG
ncbi:MAG: SMI1/KNR4 family protein [Sphingomonas sp.]